MKLTRKSYNRRVFSFGALVFLAIALMSTGFATWVMSTNAETSDSGNVNIGTITDGALSFVETGGKKVVFDETTGSEFRFDGAEGDDEGEIKSGTGEGATYENLGVKFTVQIQPAQYFDYLSVKVENLPQGILDAADAGYIVLPDAATETVKISTTEQGIEVSSGETKTIDDFNTDVCLVDSTSVPGVVKVTYTINFEWGTVFGGQNPGYYLDSLDEHNNPRFTYAQKRQTMVNFKRTIHELDDSVSEADVLNYGPTSSGFTAFKYDLKLTAHAK